MAGIIAAFSNRLNPYKITPSVAYMTFLSARSAAHTTVLACLFWTSVTLADETLSLAELSKGTHYHGVAVDARDGSRVFLATHHGVFVVTPDGRATRISQDTNDYMGFTPHPSDVEVLYASGHPVGGGNLGFITSADGGRTWRQLSKGVRGPVDFHQMDVSKADPQIIYGTFGGIQVSRDGGENWTIAAPLPNDVIDLAASAVDGDRLYASTRGGLLYSSDGGRSWAAAHPGQLPATMVQTGHEGELYAFVVGLGLIRTREPNLDWEVLSNVFGKRYVMHLAVDPNSAKRIYVVTQKNDLLFSTDGGRAWAEYARGDGD